MSSQMDDDNAVSPKVTDGERADDRRDFLKQLVGSIAASPITSIGSSRAHSVKGKAVTCVDLGLTESRSWVTNSRSHRPTFSEQG